MEDQWTSRLSEYLDDELASADRQMLDAHLASCADCRTTLEELRRVVARAQALTDRAPDADLWPGVASRLERPAVVLAFWRRVRESRISFTLPQAAAAGLFLAGVSAGLVWLARDRPRMSPGVGDESVGAVPVLKANFADASYDRAVADLERTLAERRAALDPKTVASIERSLQTIDRAIAEARQALDADPSNVYLNSYLAATRRRKLELLRRVSALTQTET